MKPIFVALFVVLLATAIESANHHRKHKDGDVTTIDPILEENEGVVQAADDQAGDVNWPQADRKNMFDVPSMFKFGGFKNNRGTEPSSAKRHDRSKHHPHSN